MNRSQYNCKMATMTAALSVSIACSM